MIAPKKIAKRCQAFTITPCGGGKKQKMRATPTATGPPGSRLLFDVGAPAPVTLTVALTAPDYITSPEKGRRRLSPFCSDGGLVRWRIGGLVGYFAYKYGTQNPTNPPIRHPSRTGTDASVPLLFSPP